jgi:hypothetical protein
MEAAALQDHKVLRSGMKVSGEYRTQTILDLEDGEEEEGG